MSDDALETIAIVFILIIGAIVGFVIGGKVALRGNSYGEARCKSIGGEYSYAADVCFKNGEEV